MNKFITLAAMTILLTACGTDPIQVDTVSNPPPAFTPSMPAQVIPDPVHWTVLTQTQIQEIAKANDPNFVMYALDPESMENLGTNMAEIQRYMQEQKVMILGYDSYYGGITTPVKK